MEILLWQARTNKGWVLEQLEKKSGVSKATLNRIENGQTSPTMDVMEKVARGCFRHFLPAFYTYVLSEFT